MGFNSGFKGLTTAYLWKQASRRVAIGPSDHVFFLAGLFEFVGKAQRYEQGMLPVIIRYKDTALVGPCRGWWHYSSRPFIAPNCCTNSKSGTSKTSTNVALCASQALPQLLSCHLGHLDVLLHLRVLSNHCGRFVLPSKLSLHAIATYDLLD